MRDGAAQTPKPTGHEHLLLDAMWLFNDKFERARSKFNEIKAPEMR